MASKLFTFHFSRVSIIGREITDKSNFYLEIFSKNKPISDRFNKYLFLGTHEYLFDQEIFYVGLLVKYKAIKEEIVNEDSHDLNLSTIEDAVLAKPEFVLHPNTGVLAFRPIPSRFSANQFRDKFAKLIEATFDNFFISTKVETINEDFQFQEQFKRLRKIYRINLSLHPSNPNYAELWKPVDKGIKELEAIEYKQELIGGLNGLNKVKIEEGDIYSGLLMASDGYGLATIDGEVEDGRHISVSTSDNPTVAKIPLIDEPENLIQRLYRTFQLVWKRTKNEQK